MPACYAAANSQSPRTTACAVVAVLLLHSFERAASALVLLELCADNANSRTSTGGGTPSLRRIRPKSWMCPKG